ncbi:hypothetical protein [Thalassobellus citreus]|uniref:hypothetical protein n=1 Tax=Thalassobellus citreus TaxID=3367752 RepID=UPI0037A7070D
MSTKKEKGILLLEEVLENLQNPKLPLFNSIQKLNRIGKLLNEEKLTIWTEVQLGNVLFTQPIQNWLDSYTENERENSKESKKDLKEKFEKLEEIGINLANIFTSEELSAKSIESGGGLNNIGFVEEKYNDFIKSKRGNDGTFYKSNLSSNLSIVKAIAYKKASAYHKKYAYESLPESNFEILKANVEDVLFEIDPELAEKLMLVFKSVSSDKPEEWSQALTSCRRFFEKLADNLFPATDEKLNGRSLSKENYINRLWAYMDKSIESKSNRDLAKKHVDLLGLYLQGTYKIANKGVHSHITRIESIKTVMHIYLVCADLLDYLDKDKFINKKPDIYNASLDELEVVGNISRKIAKEIIKLRVNKSKITEEDLKKIPGVGIKTLKNFLSNISIEKK